MSSRSFIRPPPPPTAVGARVGRDGFGDGSFGRRPCTGGKNSSFAPYGGIGRSNGFRMKKKTVGRTRVREREFDGKNSLSTFFFLSPTGETDDARSYAVCGKILTLALNTWLL